METRKKPPCEYGSKCYRKNPKHFEEFSHPSTTAEHNSDVSDRRKESPKKLKTEKDENSFTRGQTKMKQTTLQFGTNKNQVETTSKEVGKKEVNMRKTASPRQTRGKNATAINSSRKTKQNQSKGAVKNGGPDKGRKRNQQDDPEPDAAASKKPRNSKLTVDKEAVDKLAVDNVQSEGDGKILNSSNEDRSDDGNDDDDDDGEVKGSWTFVKRDLKPIEPNTPDLDLQNKTVEEIIKALFLVDMPPCFYSFLEFCKSLNGDNPEKSLEVCGLRLVGPFDVLLGKMNLSVPKDLALCHWRFFYDPPEFQTVLATSKEFHIGYWRDDPRELPVFLASNDSAKDCIIKMETENIFGTVNQYCDSFMKTCDPFLKVKVSQLLKKLNDWAEEHSFSLEKKTSKMAARQKKVVTKTFHKLGIVVPVEKKTELGYRPLIESDKNIKNICTLIMNADDDNEKESLWEKLQPLITAANIANDECDFGNGLELGIDLFCMGSPVFHETVEHLLTVAYSLLNRHQFETIIRAHLKRRKKGVDLSIN